MTSQCSLCLPRPLLHTRLPTSPAIPSSCWCATCSAKPSPTPQHLGQEPGQPLADCRCYGDDARLSRRHPPECQHHCSVHGGPLVQAGHQADAAAPAATTPAAPSAAAPSAAALAHPATQPALSSPPSATSASSATQTAPAKPPGSTPDPFPPAAAGRSSRRPSAAGRSRRHGCRTRWRPVQGQPHAAGGRQRCSNKRVGHRAARQPGHRGRVRRRQRRQAAKPAASGICQICRGGFLQRVGGRPGRCRGRQRCGRHRRDCRCGRLHH